MKLDLLKWAIADERTGQKPRRVLSRAVAEIIGSRFMRRLGIGAPDVAIARTPTQPGWLNKFPVGKGQVLSVKKIPGAISLHYLSALYGIESTSEWNVPATGVGVLDFGVRVVRTLLDKGKSGQVANPEAFHSDFALPADASAMRSAIAWNSTPRLEIHAARLLLGCSTAHAGNILVDARGKLYSIDHEIVSYSGGKDIEMLAEHIKLPSVAHSTVRKVVNNITVRDVEALFDDLPALGWPLGSKAGTVAYFQKRIAMFQKHFH